MYGGEVFRAIEVKNSGVVRPADVRALRAFIADYPECEPLLLYRGTDRLEVGGVSCVPIEQFLEQIRPGRGMTAGLT